MAKKDKSKDKGDAELKKGKKGKGRAGSFRNSSVKLPSQDFTNVSNPELPPEEEEEEPPQPEPLPNPMPILNVTLPTEDYKTLQNLFECAFLIVERVICQTPTNKCIVFQVKSGDHTSYKLFDGCICNPMRFRYVDAYAENSALKNFPNKHELLKYILGIRGHKIHLPKMNTVGE